MATLNDTPTRAELVAAVLANPDTLADCLTNAGIDPTAGREKFEKILTSFTPKPRKPGDSVTFKQNVKYFDTLRLRQMLTVCPLMQRARLARRRLTAFCARHLRAGELACSARTMLRRGLRSTASRATFAPFMLLRNNHK